MVVDVLVIYLSIVIAFLAQFDSQMLIREISRQGVSLILIALSYLAFFNYFRLYERVWQYASLDVAIDIVKAATLGIFSLIIIQYLLKGAVFPRSVIILTWLLTIFLTGGTRLSLRVLSQRLKIRRQTSQKAGRSRQVLIIGAGEAGEMVLSGMQKHPELGYHPIGLIDDNPKKQGVYLHGVRVLGTRAELQKILAEDNIDEVIIAMPAASGTVVRDILNRCEEFEVRTKIVPGLPEIIYGFADLKDIRDVEVEDLLRREPTKINLEEVSRYLSQQRVLVTGAGGSIGSEICRQIVGFNPAKLILLDHDENSIFEMGMELPDLDLTSFLIADIKDEKKLRQIFESYRPDIVFHAAAHKHVPLMEENGPEAVKNNIRGTKLLAQIADEFGVKKFIFISTDKAVNPVNVMGASKRVGELIMQLMGRESSCKFVSVRFGNVLASQGSVTSVFQKQIKAGGPVTITHPQMKRYFMTISEAVQLVIQAGALGEGGETFILDMGEPIRIVDLAKDLIRLSGFKPEEDIKIKFSGIRAGEKLEERLLSEDEEAVVTNHQKILVTRPENNLSRKIFFKQIEELEELASKEDVFGLKSKLAEIVPTYKPE